MCIKFYTFQEHEKDLTRERSSHLRKESLKKNSGLDRIRTDDYLQLLSELGAGHAVSSQYTRRRWNCESSYIWTVGVRSGPKDRKMYYQGWFNDFARADRSRCMV